jgi:cyanate permease
VIAAVALLVLDAVTPLGLAVWILQVVLVWVATLWANRREIITVAAVCATFIVLGFWLSPKTGPITWVDQSNVLLGLGSVSALTHSCLRRMAAEETRRKAAQELGQMVRILSSLLPICTWCKKIRNEAGTWEQLEIYVRSHAHAEFTQGMCQECAARFNP